MSDVALEVLANQIRRAWSDADQRLTDARLTIGKLLLDARARIKRRGWAEWFGTNIPDRSLRDARRCMKMASADDPQAAREAEKARNRAAKPAGSRAAAGASTTNPFRAHDEGVGAAIRGVAEADCPFAPEQPHVYAAWRKGWLEQHERTGASPPAADPLAAVREALDRYWPQLKPAEQELLVDWLIEHPSPVSTAA